MGRDIESGVPPQAAAQEVPAATATTSPREAPPDRLNTECAESAAEMEVTPPISEPVEEAASATPEDVVPHPSTSLDLKRQPTAFEGFMQAIGFTSPGGTVHRAFPEDGGVPTAERQLGPLDAVKQAITNMISPGGSRNTSGSSESGSNRAAPAPAPSVRV